jgi:hypothetical protein
LIEKSSLCELSNIISDLKNSMSSESLGMHNSFWNSLSVEMSKLVDKGEIL